MLSVIVNTITVLVGSLCGLLLKRGIPERVSGAVMQAIGLCNVLIGISGAMAGENTLVMILAMAIGTMLGTWADLDGRFSSAVERVEAKFRRGDGTTSLAEGFIAGSLLFCVGGMTIVGCLQSGLVGDHSTIFMKSIMDLISSFIFAATLGLGVVFSAGFVFVFQGAIVLAAQFIAPVLSDAVIAEISCAGSLIIVALGLNLLGISKLKIMNFLPAVFLPIALCPLYDLVAGWLSGLL